jgi:hypothetical protein
LSEIGLRIGHLYPVYGVAFRDGVPWFLVCEEEDDSYPIPECSCFFDLVDARVDKNWVLSMQMTNVGSLSLLPKQWADDPSFLEKMVQGDSQAISVFSELKTNVRKLMNLPGS